MKACDEYYDAQFKAYAYDCLADLCVQYHNMFMDKNSEVYDCVADLLGTLVELFNKYANIKTQAAVQQHAGGKTLTWSMIDTPTFIKELEKRMGKNDELYVDLHGFITQFYTYLFENKDIWTGKEKADIVETINQFISSAFETVLDKSMDYYIDFIAKCNGKSLQQYCDDLFRELDKRSNIMFPVSSAYYTTVAQPGYSIVSVPNNAATIRERAKLNVSKKSLIKNSDIKESIYMMNFESAVPLNAYADLSACHDSYVQLAPSTQGLHLYETKEQNWRDLPSPYPESEWLAGHYVEKEAVENKAWRELFDKAKTYGYIVWDADKQQYICKWGELIKANAILKKEKVNPDDELNDFGSVSKCNRAIKNALKDEERLTNKKAIYDTKVRMEDDEMVPDDVFAKNLFIKMVTVRNEIKKMVEDHDQALEIQEKLKKYTAMDDMMADYLKLFYTETIKKRRGMYVYRDKNDQSQEFASLKGKENDYPDYNLFNKLMAMDEKERKDLLKLSENNYSQKQKTDEDYDAMQEKLEEITSNLKSVITELNDEWDEVDNGQTILQIYRSLHDTAKSILKEF